jgi:hypothetical protein
MSPERGGGFVIVADPADSVGDVDSRGKGVEHGTLVPIAAR